MMRLSSKNGRLLFALVLGLWTVGAKAGEFRYCYVSFYAALPPEIVGFDPKAIDNGGRTYGDAYKCSAASCDEIIPYVGVYENGALTVLQPTQPAFVFAANDKGMIGGSALFNLQNFTGQAALFHGRSIELVAPQPGEVDSAVILVNDRGTAVVRSSNMDQSTYLLYRKGKTAPLNFGPTISTPIVTGINELSILSGTENSSNPRGFRFTPWISVARLLYPIPPEDNAWGLDINNRSEVLGYSFIANGVERIGVWNFWGLFKTYFVEGTHEFPTISNRLVFNERNQIVITFVSSPANERLKTSYLVPRPGSRLNVANLVTNLPMGANLSYIVDINNRGDMIGLDFFSGDAFLLKRDGRCRSRAVRASEAAVQPSGTSAVKRRAIPPALATLLQRKLTLLKPGAALP